MERGNICKTAALAGVACLGLGLGTATAAAEDGEVPAEGTGISQLEMFTNDSVLDVHRKDDETWVHTFTNATGGPYACVVHVQPAETMMKMLDWMIANPDEAKEKMGLSFGDELDAEREANNLRGAGAFTIHISEGKATGPEELSFDPLPTVDEEYRAMAMCKTGGIFEDGDAFIELSPEVSPLIGSIAELPLGSLENGSLADSSLGDTAGGSAEDMVDADLIWNGGSLGSLAGGS